jgi:transcription termination/antitermination protein NusG
LYGSLADPEKDSNIEMLSGTQNGEAMLELRRPSFDQTHYQSTKATGTDLAWYALRTRPRHEKRVHAALEEKHIQTFLPLLSEEHPWSDRRQIIQVPLFPGYIFTRMQNDLSHRIGVLQTLGVLSFVGFRGVGTPIPEEQIHALQAIVEARISFGSYAFLNVGQKVRIVGGSLDGIQGIITEKKGETSLVISVDLIQRSIAIRVAGYRVTPV